MKVKELRKLLENLEEDVVVRVNYDNDIFEIQSINNYTDRGRYVEGDKITFSNLVVNDKKSLLGVERSIKKFDRD